MTTLVLPPKGKKLGKRERIAYREMKRRRAIEQAKANAVKDDGGRYATVQFNKIVGHQRSDWAYRSKRIKGERYTTATRIAKGIKI